VSEAVFGEIYSNRSGKRIVLGYFASQSKSFLVSATAQNYYEAPQISPKWNL
jgi:hypothetical protein